MDWNTETVDIIYAPNDGCAGYLTVPLYSLLDNNRNIPRMNIYILPVGMSEAYLERLADVTGAFCRGLHVVELGNLRERLDYEVDTRGFDISAMGRLSTPKVLPDRVREVLHLDCDTIVNGSIRPLYEAELGSYLVGMAMEPMVCREMKNSIGMKRDELCYNSGALPMGLEAWRDQDVLGQLPGFYRSHEGSLLARDQDTISGALGGRIMSLPIRYNYFTNYRYFRYKTLASMCGTYRPVGEDEYGQTGKAPVIIHYLGNERPRIAGNHSHLRRLYGYYLDKTPWKGTPKQEGKRLYMQTRWAPNHVSLICPASRLWISHRPGMRLVDSRRQQKTFGSGKRYRQDKHDYIEL